ncbi:hypothetical protein RhiJN_14279 [Ceratobasidium sp. AG-Ba]|nr:hypothetical protein RhiJN_14279 [Ceratobasidium sp. AG-Ba]QRW14830.1 hypothetical protein RhiLY_13829 [Ceratobasidium sp. AG-Ba]
MQLLERLRAFDYVPLAQADNYERLKEARIECVNKLDQLDQLQEKSILDMMELHKIKSISNRLQNFVREWNKEALLPPTEKKEAEAKESDRQEARARAELRASVWQVKHLVNKRNTLAFQASQMKECQDKIDTLYQGLFKNPTPVIAEYPEQEEAYQSLILADKDYRNQQIALNVQVNILTKLCKARRALFECLFQFRSVQDTILESQRSHYPFSNRVCQVTVAPTLVAARYYVSRFESAWAEAANCTETPILPPYEHKTFHSAITQALLDAEHAHQTEGTEQDKGLAKEIKSIETLYGLVLGAIQEFETTSLRAAQETLEGCATTLDARRKQLAHIRCGILLKLSGSADPLSYTNEALGSESGTTNPTASASNPEVGSASMNPYTLEVIRQASQSEEQACSLEPHDVDGFARLLVTGVPEDYEGAEGPRE